MKKNIIFISVLLSIIISIAGCGKKNERTKKEEPAKRAVLQPQVEIEEDTEEITPEIITYTVKLSGRILSLYEVNGDMEKLITSIEITPDFYPAEDIYKLEQGIKAYCKEDGYKILENFAN